MAIDEKWSYSECQKMLMAYLAKNKITANMTLEQSIQTQRKYKEKYTVEQFIEKLREVYDIKGEITPDKIRKARKKSDVPLEKDEQKAFCKWLKDKGYRHWANGLGVKLSYDVKYIASLKSQGHYPSIPDMTIFLNNGKTCFVEMKRTQGGVATHAQKEWVKWLNENGYPAKICKGCAEAIEFVESLEIF